MFHFPMNVKHQKIQSQVRAMENPVESFKLHVVHVVCSFSLVENVWNECYFFTVTVLTCVDNVCFRLVPDTVELHEVSTDHKQNPTKHL